MSVPACPGACSRGQLGIGWFHWFGTFVCLRNYEASRFWGCKMAEKVWLGRQPDKIKMKGHSLATLAAPVSTGSPEQVLL